MRRGLAPAEFMAILSGMASTEIKYTYPRGRGVTCTVYVAGRLVAVGKEWLPEQMRSFDSVVAEFVANGHRIEVAS